ncbi:MAG: hypothetical protein AAB337_00655 [Patescibacteria group bacterium]
MSSTPNFDLKVKAILDATQSGERTCALTGQTWEMTDEEIGWYKKFNVPPSKLAPITRLRQLSGFASGVSIWWKAHAITGKPILSFVHPDNPFHVITDKEWFGNDYVNGYRWNSSDLFFDQFRKLALSIPVGALRDDGSNINCIGVDLIGAQDCYMAFGCGDAKRLMYGYMSGTDSEDCVDFVNSGRSRECFSVNLSTVLFACTYAFNSHASLHCTFIFDCRDCEFCFGATNKRHKKYLWFNEQLTKEEWQERRANVDLSRWSVNEEYLARFNILMAEAVWPEHDNEAVEESTGQNLIKCTRCQTCWWVIESTDLYSCWACLKQETAAFCVWTGWGSDCYQSVDLVNAQNAKFCVRVWRSINVEYSMDCYECQNCFGCFGLRHKQFCIFNNQFSEQEYWFKLDEIKCAMLERGEYGMFFSGDFSQNGFQFSMGKMYFEYTPEEYTAFGAPHFDPTRGAVIMPKSIDPEGTILISEIPDALEEIDPATFVGKAIHDPVLKRNFSVTPQEFDFYKAHQLPFPREHFLTRIKKLTRHSDSPVSFETTCYVCHRTITAYKNIFFQERNIHCRACYLAYLEQHG